jgi:uncharacterized membrane protein YqaE (UPF0057 family)
MSCSSGTPFCYPSNLFDYLLALIMPPLYVLIYEFRRGFENPMNIFRNLILTGLFYFPGFMHAMFLLTTAEEKKTSETLRKGNYKNLDDIR